MPAVPSRTWLSCPLVYALVYAGIFEIIQKPVEVSIRNLPESPESPGIPEVPRGLLQSSETRNCPRNHGKPASQRLKITYEDYNNPYIILGNVQL